MGGQRQRQAVAVAELLPRALQPGGTGEGTPSGPPGSNRKPWKALQAEWIELLFRTFMRRWPQGWRSNHEDAGARELWQRDLWHLGVVSKEQIDRALGKSAALKWPPSPAEFAELCRATPEDLGIPGVRAAYLEACGRSHPAAGEREWSHPAVYHAWRQVGAWELRELPASKTQPMFERVYRRLVEAAARGDPMPEVPKGLEPPGKAFVPASAETALRELSKMKAALGIGDGSHAI